MILCPADDRRGKQAEDNDGARDRFHVPSPEFAQRRQLIVRSRKTYLDDLLRRNDNFTPVERSVAHETLLQSFGSRISQAAFRRSPERGASAQMVPSWIVKAKTPR